MLHLLCGQTACQTLLTFRAHILPVPSCASLTFCEHCLGHVQVLHTVVLPELIPDTK